MHLKKTYLSFLNKIVWIARGLYKIVTDTIEIAALFVLCVMAVLFGLAQNINDKIIDGFEKHADRVGLILGLSIMAGGAIFFVVVTAYRLFA